MLSWKATVLQQHAAIPATHVNESSLVPPKMKQDNETYRLGRHIDLLVGWNGSQEPGLYITMVLSVNYSFKEPNDVVLTVGVADLTKLLIRNTCTQGQKPFIKVPESVH